MTAAAPAAYKRPQVAARRNPNCLWLGDEILLGGRRMAITEFGAGAIVVRPKRRRGDTDGGYPVLWHELVTRAY